MADHLADDSLTEDIWASPTPDKPVRSQSVERPRTPKTPKTPKTPTRAASPTYDHEAALRKELEGVKNVNRAIEGVIGTLERAQANMGVRRYMLSPYISSRRLIFDVRETGAGRMPFFFLFLLSFPLLQFSQCSPKPGYSTATNFVMCFSRLCPEPFPMPRRCSTPGHGYYHKQNTTNVWFLTQAGRVRLKISSILRPRRYRSSKRRSAEH